MDIGPSYKTCNQCGENKRAEDYYMAKKARANICKRCANERTKKYRAARPEQYKKTARLRARKRRADGVKFPCELTEKFRLSRISSVQNYRKSNPLKAAAQTASANAIRDGKLIRQPCEVCGTTSKVQGHHDDYSKPLEVRWLCPKHHSAHHRALNMPI